MSTKGFNHGFLLAFLLLHIVFASVLAANENDFYIVFMRDHPMNERLKIETHLNVLSSLKESENDASKSHVYSYTKSFNAFAAKLSEDEATKLSSMDEVVSVFRNQYHKLHTTRSWDFIGLTPSSKRVKAESDIIVGVFDTGIMQESELCRPLIFVGRLQIRITPTSESFTDEGFGPPPRKWKGSCPKAANFSGCNNYFTINSFASRSKLIGARHYKLDNQPNPSDILSPIDTNGHGTHTSSTATGSLIPNANVFGLAQGTARGAVPSARVAMYKICWSTGCSDMDILAAFDDAIHDGVDVISLSVGGVSGLYTQDSISVGSFHATRKGVLTVASAGNSGPDAGSVSNHAPWILTVAANGIDRQFRSKVDLGNGVTLSGIGVSTIEPKQKLYPFASGVDVAKDSDNKDLARYCQQDSMDPKKVKGKIIYCEDSRGSDSVVKALGGVGTVIKTDTYLDTAFLYIIPSTVVDTANGEKLNQYINSTKTPSAVVHKSEGVKIPAPVVASFSSRGPNSGSKHILKPDITAPGIDILASYTPLKSLTGKEGDTQFSKFNFMSGTSMSCPHVAGSAAYVKSFHPDWSPAAIKSALVTTATQMNSKTDKDAEFAYGSGQVNPAKAINPGLVYDMDDTSYIQFLCHEQYKEADIGGLIGQKNVNCSQFVRENGEDALNYPTMQLALRSNKKTTTGNFWRSVTNVGPPKSVYNVTIKAPAGVKIVVKPMSLSFTKASEKKSFKVVVKAKPISKNVMILSGSLTWKSSDYTVRSPIVIYNQLAEQDMELEESDLVKSQ
ncbi:hypothetical protein CASFOL_031149 [Castilleja foliolosa]|uniref:Cucumisin n=1 Tax=Castilleja foliolosa TaxID=1961234 RepID=A0ABD3C555_9LAMI